MNENPQVTIPTRVIYNDYADATTPERAKQLYGVEPDIIFLRNDGWSLGASKNLENVAYNVWAGSWQYYARKGDTHFRPISEYYTEYY